MGKQVLIVFIIFLSCGDSSSKKLTAQQIVDRAITAAGGKLYEQSMFKFNFRDKTYVLEREGNSKILKRITTTDSAITVDIKKGSKFTRLVNGSIVEVADSMAHKYNNSINSVHYFAYLPYGLNDAAVNKKLLGASKIKNQEYYKLQVTFNQENGGEDYDDVYIYWFNKQTFMPDYLAYEFHVDGGGMRFREAFNERKVKGIRFVDYRNYSPRGNIGIFEIDQLFNEGKLEFLSEIVLSDIEVHTRN